MNPSEWEAFRALRLAALRESPGAFASTAAHEAGFSEARWRQQAVGAFVAVDGDAERFVGMAGGFIPEDLPDRVVVWGMWVAPAARRRGLGRMLLEAVEAWARERGVRFLRLSATDRAPDAERLYRAAGFQTLVTQPLDDSRMQTVLERRV